MRVSCDALPDIEKFAQNHMRGLVTDAGESDELGLASRHFPAMLRRDLFSGADNRLRLIPEKRNRGDFFRKSREVCLGEIARGFVLLPKPIGELVDGFVGTLCRENDCGSELKRCLVGKFALRERVRALQVRDDLHCSFVPQRHATQHTRKCGLP